MTEQLRAWARIDSTALRHNVAAVRKLVGERFIAAVVKANAYGHNLDIVVPALGEQVDGFAVATIEEGIAVRELIPDRPVMVLSEFNSASQLELFRTFQLQPVVHNTDQAEWLGAVAPLTQGIWLKVDSGMRRLGVEPRQARAIWSALQDAGHPVSLMSHLASAEDPNSNQTSQQLERMDRVRTELKPTVCSMANSAGLVVSEATRLDHVRPGLLLYGISPFDDHGVVNKTIAAMKPRPVMTLEARLIAVKDVQPGDCIGYGATFDIAKPGRIGVVGFGYADGYPRSIRATGEAWFRGQRVPLAGRVSMDMLTLDLSDVPTPETGEVVQLWGPDLPVAEVAGWANTIPYELLCRVASRVPRLPT